MKLKKVLVSFLLGVMLGIVPIFAVPKTVSSVVSSVNRSIVKSSPACPYFIRDKDSQGTWSCYYDGEDDEYCYYTCYLFNY